MLRKVAVVAAFVTLLSACGASTGTKERQVLVDYSSDEFASFIAQDSPRRIEITPGTTVVWKQTWTGEPHTVTGGSLSNKKLADSVSLLKLFTGYESLRAKNPRMIDPENAGDATMLDFFAALKHASPKSSADAVVASYRSVRARYRDLPDIDHPPATLVTPFNHRMDEIASGVFDSLLYAHGEGENDVAQNVGQRCFLKSGAPPEDKSQPCTADQQRQPEFDGTYTFYNSGILPYEGPRGNTYRVRFSPKTKPGTYFFYCAVHGPNQLSEVVVKPKGTKVPAASAVLRQGRQEATDAIAPMAKTFHTATRTNKVHADGRTLKGPFAGLPNPQEGSINEFVPRVLHVKANAPITWRVIGADHTISFNVPPYLPIMNFASNGTVSFNAKVHDPAGGAPKPPDFGDNDKRVIDGGTFSGNGFWSSGVVGGEPSTAYTLRIAKKGMYNYACLIHPRMIGKVVVS